MMPSLMIDHLSINLRSGTDNLVSEISFAIKEGESLILLGQSGSGKTMTCSAVLNLLDPKKFKVSGSVFFGETDLLNSSEKQRRGIYGNQIVYIPQNPMTALDPSMRIGRQMDETLRLHSDKSRQQRYNYILRLLHDVGLDDPDRVYRAYISRFDRLLYTSVYQASAAFYCSIFGLNHSINTYTLLKSMI